MGQYGVLHFFNILRLSNRYIVLVPVLALILLAAGCDDNFNGFEGDAASGDSSNIENDNTAPVFTSQPIFTLAPNPDTPLAGLLELGTDEPTSVSVTITEATTTTTTLNRGAFESLTIEFDDRAIEHSLPILGFTPDGSFMLQITVSDAFGNQTQFDQPILVDTDPLPEGFPPIEVTSNPEMMEPGVTIFPLRPRVANTELGSFLVAVNAQGDVVWYKRFDDVAYGDVTRISNGNILFIESNSTITEINMLGDIVRQWHTLLSSTAGPDSIVVNTDVFHHEVFEMPNGNLLTLGVEVILIDNFPASDTDPLAPTESAFVAGDTVLELSTDGTIVNEWSILEMLDPFRIGYNSLLGFWNATFPEFEQGTKDWSHGNAVIYDPSDDSIIVSLRHQDAVIKFDRATGDLSWIIGTHANWDTDIFGDLLFDPIGLNFLWQFHQHAPMVLPNGNILIYDNGNLKASPFDETVPASENFSRAVEYSLDLDNMEIEQVWEFGKFADEILYAPFIGDADYMPVTGNVLITHGGVAKDAEGVPTDNIATAITTPRIIEVTHTTPAEKVFDLSIEDDNPENMNGWTVYRSERLPSLYPEQ